jgi:hypothetical protein
MRDPQLHAALSGFLEEAAWELAAETERGTEVPFELVEQGGAGGRGTPLYCYRPLTDEFIRRHGGLLHRLPARPGAARALTELDGVDRYLRQRGHAHVPADLRERGDEALTAFVDAVFADASEFELTPQRFTRAYEELEAAVFAGRTHVVVVATVLGLGLESAELALGDGLVLTRPDALSDPPPEALHNADEGAATMAVLSAQEAHGQQSVVTRGRIELRRLLSALRLFDAGQVALGPLAWTRADGGPWRSVPLGTAGRATAVLHVTADQEDELRAFCNLVAHRAPTGGELTWALARYEMGCERVSPFEALTDYLLALRALLEPEGPGSGRLAARLAAICALPEERATLAERVAHAISLERAAVAGLAPAEPGADELVEEVAGHLRALLRDAICGHLDSDLRAVADRIAAESDAPRVPAG